MEKNRFYDEEQAQKKLDEDSSKIEKVLLPYVQKCFGHSFSDILNEKDANDIQISLPEGWVLNVSSNAFLVRIGDGENEEKAFFAADIFVDFEYSDEINFSKSIIKRYPLGYCNCGNKIKPLMYLLSIQKQYEKGGINKFLASVRSKFSNIKLKMYPYWELQLNYNMCEKCL